MDIDVIHMVITMVVVGILVFGMQHFGVLEGKSKLARAVIIGLALFLVLFVLNLVFPYGHFL